MHITFLVHDLYGTGGTEASVSIQASALAADHDVSILSMVRTADAPHYHLDSRVAVEFLVDERDPDNPSLIADSPISDVQAKRLAAQQSALVPDRWDQQFNALIDLAAEDRLRTLASDVVVSVTPGLLAYATILVPDEVVRVHQEHRSSSQRNHGMEPLLAFAPRADVVALLTTTMRDWFVDELDGLAPETVVMPNPLPIGYRPRATLDSSLIVAAGRLVPEKQFTKLVNAFAEVSDRHPEWRLRICGAGPTRGEIIRLIRKHDLWGRVELTGLVDDMTETWAQASLSALTSRAEGFPLVVQEAMAAGVPVVSFDCASGPREIITHEVDGLLVTPESVSGMAAALDRLMGDDALRTRLGRNAAAKSLEYDARRIAERWVQIFADARANRAHRSAALARADRRPSAAASFASPAESAAQVTPAEARESLLGWLSNAAAAASQGWFVLPSLAPDSPTLVVPVSERDQFLDALAATPPPLAVSVHEPAEHGWPERTHTLLEGTASIRRGRRPRVLLEPASASDPGDLLSYGTDVACEFWERSIDGRLIAPNRNGLTDEISESTEFANVRVGGDIEVRVPKPLHLPTAAAPTFEIDVVYTWVDGNDPEWDETRAERLAQFTGTARTRESSGRARFVNHDELRYSLRSIHMFAPWARRIHIVTAGQRPDWLDIDHPRINLVDHSDILPADALPTFNSHAIETALHRIEGLAEHFVYFNDDVFLGRACPPSRLFDAAGSTACFFSPTVIGANEPDDAPPFLKAAHNNRRLIAEEFGHIPTRHLAHTPFPMRVSTMEALVERFPTAIDQTAHSPFRSDDDVSTTSSLAPHFALLTGAAYEAPTNLLYVNLTNSDVDRTLEQAVADRSHDFICLGDQHDAGMRDEKLEPALQRFYADYYPIAAPWELS